MDTDPADRGGDRLLAYLGLLDDAAPLFRAGTRVPRAGVLLALPALTESGVFDIAREVHGSIGPAFHWLRTTAVATLLMALLRLKRPEALQVAHRMFERWRQENFFKYLREEYALDALADHAVVPDNPTRDVPNPVRRRLDDKVHDPRRVGHFRIGRPK